MKELEAGSYYLCIINAKEYIFKWDGTRWVDSLFGIVPQSLLEHMHIAGRMVLSQSLSDIRAEAVIDMAEKEMSVGRMHDGTKRSFVFASDIYDHANRIKEG